MASSSCQTPSCSVSYTMAPATSESLSSSASPHAKWDVFLSYRGEDTRYIFTDHLYNALVRQGIRTFRDDPEIGPGDVIADSLFQAIQKSKIYVIVFSKNYASSRWCLNELVEIYKCYETMQRSVIAVYYNIEPSVVRHQSDSFEKDLKKQASRSNITREQLEKWRLTLKNVAEFSGITTVAKRYEADIVNEIVEKVVNKIISKRLYLPEYLVGLDSPVERIRSMLSSDSTKGVMKIGIYGMRGAGKTTLAKAIYNEIHLNFQGSCFLAKVREKGLESLQEKLINDILKSKEKVEVQSVEEGTVFIKEKICFAKILVVLDDLDSCTQLDSLVGPFACGSVVIITTTDEHLLVKSDVEADHKYRVNKLDVDESLTLFNRHAFRNTKPDDSLMALSKDIICYAGGLPLALEIFGSSLYKRTKDGWDYLMKRLERNPNASIQQRLIISLDALKPDYPVLKEIFIDIACFFVGKKKKEVVEIMDTYYSGTDHSIDILNERCLLTINDRCEIAMHGLLEDMGKNIARNNSHDQPERQSRLWERKDICNVLKRQKGTDAIECMIPCHDLETLYSGSSPSEAESFCRETFESMTKLRFLSLNGEYLTGSFEQTFENLRWLSWTRCPSKCLPSNFCPEQLVTLLLTHSSMRTMWKINKVSPVFENLKNLNMSYSPYLTATPDFTKLPFLVTLNLEVCESLEKVHESIGTLKRLVILDLHGCVELRRLPDSICYLRSLKSLNIDCCSSLEALPIDLGNIKSLSELYAEGLTVSKLPDSIGKLSKLVELRLGSKMGYLRIPHGYHNPFSRRINSNKNLETLPDTICFLRALEVLNIYECSTLRSLPMDLGNIKSLKEINAEGLTVQKLPDSIGFLINLVELRLYNNSSLVKLPRTICNLRGLKVLNIGYCSSLQSLPKDLGNIESLEKINAEGLTVSKLPSSIGKLCKLVKLILRGNMNLKTLPDTISNLRSLEILNISLCENLGKLPDQLWKLTRLRVLDAGAATRLEIIPGIESSQTALSLHTLALSKSLLTALPSGIGQLSQLESLDLRHCRQLLTISELPHNLKLINAVGCKYIKSIPNLSKLKQLEKLELNGCRYLKEIQGLEGLTSLREIHVERCYSLQKDTFTERFFQIYSGLGHRTMIYGHYIPRWISRTSELGSPVFARLSPDYSWLNFLGMILCFDLRQLKRDGFRTLEYSVKATMDFKDFSERVIDANAKLTIIIPRPIFSVKDGDDEIELNSNFKFYGIRLLYKTDMTV